MIPKMQLNPAWKQTRLDIEKRIRELKELRREPYQPRWTWREAAELRRMKEVATQLYVIRAHVRGRVHNLGETYQGKPACEFIAEVLNNQSSHYLLEVTEEAA